MSLEDDLDEYIPTPRWRHALRVLTARGLSNGDVIEKSELVDLFGLKTPITAADQQKYQLDFMAQYIPLRDELLEEHRIALRTLRGDSAYQVLPPAQQTDYAMQEGMRDLSRTMRRMAKTVAYVRHEELTDDQRKANADAQAKVAMLAGMVRKRLT
jgi:hypothetical protein